MPLFFDFNRSKALVVFIVIVAIACGIVGFALINSVWNVTPQANYEITRNEHGFLYWLLYELPSSSVQVQSDSQSSGYAKSIPVLLYHGEGGSSANMPLSTFVDEMRTLKENGWQTITMEQFDEWEKGEIQLPDKSFLLTFDDGRKDTYYEADPVLQQMGYTAVMFVITGFSLPPDGETSNFYLNQTELANMVESGRWELESHGDEDHSLYAVQSTTDPNQTATTTTGHFLSNKFWDPSTDSFETNIEFTTRVTNDLENSKQTLEQDFGISVDAFAYPFNDFGDDTVNFTGSEAILDQVIPTIYTYAFYQTWPQNGDSFNYPLVNNGPGSTPYMIKRIEPGLDWSGPELLSVLETGEAKSLPYQTSSFGPDWVDGWGNVTQTAQGLDLSASTSTGGADSFLNGSGWWTDYDFSATIDWQAGDDVSLLARDDANEEFVACAFTQGEVEIEMHDGGDVETFDHVDMAFPQPENDAQIGISVDGDVASCYVNGGEIVSSTVPSMPTQGSVGVEVWDPQNGVAQSIVKSVSVQATSPGG